MRNSIEHCTQISHQLSVCVWIYPQWIRWYPLIEVFHLKTSAPAWENERLISCFLKDHNSKGFLGVRVEFVDMKNLEFRDIRVFKTNNSFALHKILRFPFHLNCFVHKNETFRRWNRLCFSVNFDQNEAQVSFNGQVSAMTTDPIPMLNPKGDTIM